MNELFDGYVDLGLPSGLLWATCNLGAASLEDYGDYYAWGETKPKSDYSLSTYRYASVDADGNLQKLTKYYTGRLYGTKDHKTTLEATLEAVDDAATTVIGKGARMPTQAEWQELIDNTTAEWTTVNGVEGRKYTSKMNGNDLFLPAAGYRHGSQLDLAGTDGLYWSSSLIESFQGGAWYMDFSSSRQNVRGSSRHCGLSVRAVRSQN